MTYLDMSITEFAIPPEELGLPSIEELKEMRIWDNHYHGARQHDVVWPYMQRMGVERVFSLDVCRMLRSKKETEQRAREDEQFLKEHEDHMSGLVRIDPTRVDDTLEHIERWVGNGPCIGMKTGTRHSEPITVAHSNYDPIIDLLADLEAVIYIHTNYQVGGEPRTYYGGTRTGESTPADVAELASRFPDVPMICGHQGSQWELGVRAIRPHKNVYLEFSGMDPESGAVEYAVKELGAERIVWGCHAATRGFANELSKVYDADITKEERKLIFGTNLRRLSESIHRKKGIEVEV